jgi:hypothetical protein
MIDAKDSKWHELAHSGLARFVRSLLDGDPRPTWGGWTARNALVLLGAQTKCSLPMVLSNRSDPIPSHSLIPSSFSDAISPPPSSLTKQARRAGTLGRKAAHGVLVAAPRARRRLRALPPAPLPHPAHRPFHRRRRFRRYRPILSHPHLIDSCR